MSLYDLILYAVIGGILGYAVAFFCIITNIM